MADRIRTDSTISDIIDRTVRSRFPGVSLYVEVSDDEDHDGDPILRVRVVYDTAAPMLDVGRMTSLVRHLRSALDGTTGAFPLVSFVSARDEAKYVRDKAKRKRAAA